MNGFIKKGADIASKIVLENEKRRGTCGVLAFVVCFAGFVTLFFLHP